MTDAAHSLGLYLSSPPPERARVLEYLCLKLASRGFPAPPLAVGRGLALPTLGGRTFLMYFESEPDYASWLLALRTVSLPPT